MKLVFSAKISAVLDMQQYIVKQTQVYSCYLLLLFCYFNRTVGPTRAVININVANVFYKKIDIYKKKNIRN